MTPALRRTGIALWLATALPVAYCAYRAAPLGLRDDPGYQRAYWTVVAALVALFVIIGLRLVGVEAIVQASRSAGRALRWPRAATPPEIVGVGTLIVAALGATPHIRFMMRTGSSGDPPFSYVQARLMMMLFRPFLAHDSSPALLFSLVVGFWLLAGLIVAVCVLPVQKRLRLSTAAAALLIAAVTQVGLVALRMVSPFEMPG